MSRIKVHFIKATDKNETFFKPLLEYRNVNLFACFKIVTDEMPIYAEHMRDVRLIFKLFALSN